MLKKRLIPTLLLQNGQLVKTTNFSNYQIIGNPKIAIQFFNAWAVDEIVFLNISKSDDYTSLMRRDYNYKTLSTFVDIVEECSKICFVPIAAGGGIRTIEQMDAFFKKGVDKVIINTIAVQNKDIIKKASDKFGSQAIVVSIDVKKDRENKNKVFINHGIEATDLDPIVWAQTAESLGAGEIFLNSIDKDGLMTGYDLSLIQKMTNSVKIPVIACGGVGKWKDLADGINIGGASAVSAANIFHYTEQSTIKAKKVLAEENISVRL